MGLSDRHGANLRVVYPDFLSSGYRHFLDGTFPPRQADDCLPTGCIMWSCTSAKALESCLFRANHFVAVLPSYDVQPETCDVEVQGGIN